MSRRFLNLELLAMARDVSAFNLSARVARPRARPVSARTIDRTRQDAIAGHDENP
jgi:hypothetical protein